MKLADGTPDLRMTPCLRKDFPKIHSLSVNDEILFLCTSPKPVYEGRSGYNKIILNIPTGYEDTGCLVIPRNDRKRFRNFFLRTFDEFKYEISTISNFLELKRAYSFDLQGNYMQSSDWMDKMHDLEYFNQNDEKYILIPKTWALEIKFSNTIRLRESAIEKGFKNF